MFISHFTFHMCILSNVFLHFHSRLFTIYNKILYFKIKNYIVDATLLFKLPINVAKNLRNAFVLLELLLPRCCCCTCFPCAYSKPMLVKYER